MPYHPVFNVAALRGARQPGPVLPGHRGERPEVRSHRDTHVPARVSGRRKSTRWRSRASREAPHVLRSGLPGALAAAAAAAGRTCTTSRSTAGCGRARSSRTARARGRWSRAPSRAARCRTTRRSSPARRQGAGEGAPVPGGRGAPQSRPGALQHLLQPVPRPDRQRQRHGRAARSPPAAVVPHRSAAQAPSGTSST